MALDYRFASDNTAGVPPEILRSVVAANEGAAAAYGADEGTRVAVEAFRRHFGQHADVYLVYNGTAANVLSLSAMARSFNTVFCSHVAHLYTDECNAPERFVGCKLQPIQAADGKISVGKVKACLSVSTDAHFSQPKAISITQPTEFGTLYALEGGKGSGYFSVSCSYPIQASQPMAMAAGMAVVARGVACYVLPALPRTVRRGRWMALMVRGG